MAIRQQLLVWGIIIGVLGTFIYLVSDILLPFIVAMIAAYFLDPAADKIESWGLSRTLSTAIIIIVFFVIMAIIGIALVPILYDQLLSFIQNFPKYMQVINEKIIPSFTEFAQGIDPKAVEKIKDVENGIAANLLQIISEFALSAWNSGVAVINLLSLVFITPVVTFYVLRDWDRMIKKLDKMLPKAYAPVIEKQMKKIDDTLAGYIRGQINVCIILGIFYSVGLGIIGLNFALLIGMIAGILSFIPYAGVAFGVLASLIVAYLQFGDITQLFFVGILFVIAQTLEGAFLSPKLVGDKVGLHPVWLIFGLFCGGALFGFVGVLVAVPVTAIIGVLVKFTIEQYLASSLYKAAKK
ncbi:AI-2E family transporter [Rickettsiales bacterium]|nr:AI-2E family transporter [Rickettsiales bacterium]